MSTADDTTRFGRQVRALRRRKRLRQSDVAIEADVAQSTISLVERGHAETLSLATLTVIAGVVDARVRLSLSWRGGDLDRLTDARHAALATRVAGILRDTGWEVRTEVTFAIGVERGSVDLLAWHPPTRTLLVVEIKTVLASAEAMLRTLDLKVRLAPQIARRFAWRPTTTGQLVVLPATRTNRRHVSALADLVGPELLTRAWTVRRWLRDPDGALNAVWMLSTSDAGGVDRVLGGFERVRLPRSKPAAGSTRTVGGGARPPDSRTRAQDPDVAVTITRIDG